MTTVVSMRSVDERTKSGNTKKAFIRLALLTDVCSALCYRFPFNSVWACIRNRQTARASQKINWRRDRREAAYAGRNLECNVACLHLIRPTACTHTVYRGLRPPGAAAATIADKIGSREPADETLNGRTTSPRSWEYTKWLP
jgi:hypothetical protein